jgi:hypothetical protein
MAQQRVKRLIKYVPCKVDTMKQKGTDKMSTGNGTKRLNDAGEVVRDIPNDINEISICPTCKNRTYYKVGSGHCSVCESNTPQFENQAPEGGA